MTRVTAQSSSRPCFKGKRQESSYEPGSSDLVRELACEPAMFQIGLYRKSGQSLVRSLRPHVPPTPFSRHRVLWGVELGIKLP